MDSNIPDLDREVTISESFFGTSGNDTLIGTEASDTISGSEGDDSLVGGGGDDFLIGGQDSVVSSGGRDTLEGNEGNDAYLFSLTAAGGSQVIDEAGDTDILLIFAEDTDVDVFVTPESIVDPATFGQSAISLSLPQEGIVGLEKSGNNLIIDLNRDGVAEPENDLSVVDFFDGAELGAGSLQLINNIIDPQEIVDLFNSNEPSSPPSTIFDNAEFNAIVGTEESDNLVGSAENDSIEGGLGNDTIFGAAGDDFVSGGAGDDLISGSAPGSFDIGGSDTLAGGEGSNVYIINLSSGGGSVIQNDQGGSSVALILADNSNLDSLSSLADIDSTSIDDANDSLELFSNPENWGDAAVVLSLPQTGIVGLEKSGTDLIVDLNRDGVAEAANDLTITDYFDEQGDLGGGAPTIINNIVDSQQVIDFFAESMSDVGGDSSSTNVYRFFNSNSGVHFYTADLNERDRIQNEIPSFSYEGISYKAADPLSGQALPVYRFLNQSTGVHLYTISEAERDVVSNLDNFSFEGEAFFAYQSAVEGSIPVYRFFNSTTGAHFYTPSVEERNNVNNNLSAFESEGIAYYALPNEVNSQNLI